MKIKTKIEHEVEITTPAFYSIYGMMLMVTDTQVLTVFIGNKGIIKSERLSDYDCERISTGKYETITEKEFLKAYTEVQSELTLNYHELFSKRNEFIEMVSGGNEG